MKVKVMASTPSLLSTVDNKNATDEDLVNCYSSQGSDQSSLFSIRTCLGNNRPFKNENVHCHYENFKIKSVSKSHIVIWISLSLIYASGLLVLLTEYTHKVWFMRVVLMASMSKIIK